VYLTCAHIIKARGVVVKAFCLQRFAMSARPLETPRFVRRTQLGPNEYRKNFRQIDGDVISAVTSREADGVTPLMSKIYLRLIHAPAQYWEREGVLRFEARLGEVIHVKAWDALCEVAGVASATASKALRWMHEQGIIGYFAGKNGVGIRIFLNRATSSIGSRAAGKKILEFPPASSQEARASSGEAAFSDSYADLEVSDTDRNPRAPKNGAEKSKMVKKYPDPWPTSHPAASPNTGESEGNPTGPVLQVQIPMDEIVSRLSCELEPTLRAVAERAAAREHERTREWLESRGLPKAARVAQRETYNILRKCGVVTDTLRASNTEVGRGGDAPPGPRPLAEDEVEELAQACVAMLEVKGQSVEITLSEMSAEAGGFLLPTDAPRIRARLEAILVNARR
jgi:hypothetical protein